MVHRQSRDRCFHPECRKDVFQLLSLLLHTAAHVKVYATSVVDSPTKAKQAIVLSTLDVIGYWLYVAATQQLALGYCGTASHTSSIYRSGPRERLQHNAKFIRGQTHFCECMLMDCLCVCINKSKLVSDLHKK